MEVLKEIIALTDGRSKWAYIRLTPNSAIAPSSGQFSETGLTRIKTSTFRINLHQVERHTDVGVE
jgi:hypothetical protein